MMKRSTMRLGFWGGALCAGGALFSACGGLNGTHIVVTDESGGSAGSAGSSVAIGGTAGKLGTGGHGGTSSSTAGKSGGGEAGTEVSAGGEAGADTGGSSGETGGSGGSQAGSVNGGSGGQATGGSGGVPAGGSGGQTTAGSGGASSGGPCNSLAQIGASIAVTTGAGNPPAMTRGPITPGTYVLTKQTVYNSTMGAEGGTTFGITVVNGIATIQEVGSDSTGAELEHRTWRINTSAVAPHGITLTCSDSTQDPLNQELQADWTATATTFELTLGTFVDYQFEKQ